MSLGGDVSTDHGIKHRDRSTDLRVGCTSLPAPLHICVGDELGTSDLDLVEHEISCALGKGRELFSVQLGWNIVAEET